MRIDFGDSIRLINLTNRRVGILTQESIAKLAQLTSGHVSEEDITAARNIIAPLLSASNPRFVELTQEPRNIGFENDDYRVNYCDPNEVNDYVYAVGVLAQRLEERATVFERRRNLVEISTPPAALLATGTAGGCVALKLDPSNAGFVMALGALTITCAFMAKHDAEVTIRERQSLRGRNDVPRLAPSKPQIEQVTAVEALCEAQPLSDNEPT
jgi:hypothetical protein